MLSTVQDIVHYSTLLDCSRQLSFQRQVKRLVSRAVSNVDAQVILLSQLDLGSPEYIVMSRLGLKLVSLPLCP